AASRTRNVREDENMITHDRDTGGDMAPDPELGAALREHYGDPPLAEVDWAALRRRVNERAAPTVARRRRRTGRRQLVRRTRAGLLTAAIAATLAVVLVGRSDRSRTEAPEMAAPAPGAAGLTMEEALTADLSEREFRALASGFASTDALLLLAAGED
ncbi:MAG TPA: hypothetical protein VMM12_18100, partial [Longimicrobiales bacterium]|nr:hypothetical protein [Longimicrobiales bacterium]